MAVIKDYCHTGGRLLSDIGPSIVNSRLLSDSELLAMECIPRYVYVLRKGDEFVFKIGRTTNIVDRTRQINTQGGGGISLVFAIEISTFNTCEKTVEDVVHSYYKPKKVIGEWFRLSVEDLNDLYEFFYMLDIDDTIEDDDFWCSLSNDNHLSKNT